MPTFPAEMCSLFRLFVSKLASQVFVEILGETVK